MSVRGQEASGVRWYRAGLRLLPGEFRAAYAGPMLQVVRDALADGAAGGTVFMAALAVDLLRSAAREWIAVAWRMVMKRPIAVYSAVLIVLLGGFSLVSAVMNQQFLRRSANQPQQQMAERYAAEIRNGADPAEVLPQGHIDPSRDLDPFVIFYDAAFQPQVSDATLDGVVPAPPVGVFERAKKTGGNVLTWMPRRGARVAMVMLRVDGAHPGYLLVGRSLSTTELYEGMVYHAEAFTLLLILLLIGGAAALLAREWRRAGKPPVAGVVH
jgi:hypothetical protein